MEHNDILKGLFVDKRIDLWWKDLIGQDLKSFSDFDYDKAEKSFPTSEIAVSKVIHDKFADTFSYVDPKSTWYIWDGTIHTPCDGSGMMEKVITEFYYSYGKALEVLDQAIEKKAADLQKSATDDTTGEEAVKKFHDSMKRKFGKARKFEERLGSNAGVLAVSRRVQVDFTIASDYYEDDRRWFVFKNGVVDTYALRKGHFDDCVHAHDSSRNVTKYFDAEATGVNLGHWDTFLQSSVPDEESRKFLQKVAGAAFMGITKSRMIVNLFGPPGSGKSTFMDAIQKLGGKGVGYCAALDKSAITQTNDQVNFGQNDFKGRRFISISEPDHRKAIDDDFLKNFTGDEGVKTRTLHAAFEPWTPQGILFVASNAPLRINTRDNAIVDRLHMIEFPNQFEAGLPVDSSNEDDTIEDLLQKDKSRILEWILEGMWMYVEGNMRWNPPTKVIEHRGTIVTSASVALRWLDEMIDEGMLVIDTHNKNYAPSLSVNDAYGKFRMWKSFNGEKSALTKTYFKEDIIRKYLETMRYNGMEIFPYLIKTDKYYKEYELGFDAPQAQSKSDSGSAFRF